MVEKVCTCCGISKPYTDEFYAIGGRHSAKCRKCKKIKIGDRHVVNFMDSLDDSWQAHPDFDFIYFERDSEKIFNKKTGKYLMNQRSFVNLTKCNVRTIKWEAFNGPITEENKIVKNKIINYR